MQNINSNRTRKPVTKYLPHNFLVEKIILSSLLLNSEVIDTILRTITAETFYFKNHQEIFKAIIVMYKKNMTIDFATLHNFLQDNGLLEEIGGIQVLIEINNQTPNLIHLENYIGIIKERFIRRCLIKFGYQVINSAYSTDISLENLLQDLENQLFNLTKEMTESSIASTTELFSHVFLQLKEKSLTSNLSGITSGFSDLDSLTHGFQNSDLIIIAGRPSMGKTALCLQIAINIVKELTVPVLFFSMEMSKEQLVYRLLSTETSIDQMRLRCGNLNSNDWIKITEIIQNMSNLPFFIDDTPNLSIQDIRTKIKTILFEQGTIGLIMIDYLQLMGNFESKTDNRVQEISQLTRSLKNLAREFNVPVIALSQLSRSVENRVSKRPVLADLRESGSIEQDADLVCLLYRDNYYKPIVDINKEEEIAELIIAKHRNGPIGIVQLTFNAKSTAFLNRI